MENKKSVAPLANYYPDIVWSAYEQLRKNDDAARDLIYDTYRAIEPTLGGDGKYEAMLSRVLPDGKILNCTCRESYVDLQLIHHGGSVCLLHIDKEERGVQPRNCEK